MKLNTLLFLIVLLMVSGCADHNYHVDKEFPTLKRPIIVVGKKCDDWAGCGVVVRDSEDRTLVMGNMSTIGNMIGEYYNVGDTIK